MGKAIDIAALSAPWRAFSGVAGDLHVPVNETEFKATVALLDSLLDETHGDRAHALSPLVRLVGDLIEAYESRNLQAPAASPAEVLSMLMKANGLKQTDLAAELGGQSIVSDLLNGKRAFNARQIRALAGRFGVPPGLFFPNVVRGGVAPTRKSAAKVRKAAKYVDSV